MSFFSPRKNGARRVAGQRTAAARAAGQKAPVAGRGSAADGKAPANGKTSPEAGKKPGTAGQKASVAGQKRRQGPVRNSRIPKPEPAPAPQPKKPERPSFWKGLFAGVDWGKVRISAIFCVFGVLYVGLWCRAWYLQMIEGPRLAEMARNQHTAVELVTGRRGSLLDRNGQVLAQSVEAVSVYANPSEIKDFLVTANTLGPLLGKEPQKLFDELSTSNRQFLWIKRKIDDRTAAAVRAAKLPGIGFTKEYDRVYPCRQLAGQLLGFVDMDDKGRAGLERSLEDRLGCESRKRLVHNVPGGRKYYVREEGDEDLSGEDVRLTLDVQMQFLAEEAVAKAVRSAEARWGGALLVHVPTGDILAWAQYPFFNPNNYRDTEAHIYRNRLALDALEPGSTFKPFVMAAALQERQVSRSTVIDCEGGRWKTKYGVIRDTSSREEIPAHKVIRYSSNIGMAKIGLMMGPRTLYKYLHSLGFGERTCLPVSEARGILRKPRDWSELDTMSTSFGQAVSVTAIQMAQAYLTMLNNGVVKPLRIVLDERDQGSHQQIFSPAVVREIRRMMTEVVEEKDGTGKRARIEGVSVAGKTGTAQKADRRVGAYGSKRLASFVGFLPADKPQYLIVVMIDEPQYGMYGGVIAAPVFREIAQRSLGYSGRIALNPAPAAKETAAGAKKARVRGLALSGPESPFERRQAKPAKVRLASVTGRGDTAEVLQLPGRLAKAPSSVPDVHGKTLRAAVELFARAGVVPELKGEGSRVVRQEPAAGAAWPTAAAGDAGDAAKGGKAAGGESQPRFVLWLSEK